MTGNDVNYWGVDCIELKDNFEVQPGAEFLADFKPYGKEAHHWIVMDHLSSVRTVLDDDGNILSDFSYYPYGLRWDYNDSPDYEWNRVGALEQDGIQNHIDLMAYRSCDRTTGRFSNVDPAADNYLSISPYAFVANNPLIYIDPDGRNTIYYDSDGNELHRSEDEFDNAIVVIGSDYLDDFNNYLSDFDGSDNAISTLRGLGDNYMIDGIIDLFADNTGNLSGQSDTNAAYQFIDSNGNTRTDLIAETGSFLEKTGNTICRSTCTFSDGSVDNISDNTYIANAQSENIVGTVHKHPNSGQRVTRRNGESGVWAQGVSPADKRYNKYTQQGAFNAVIDNKNIYLYNRSSTVTAKRKFFKR